MWKNDAEQRIDLQNAIKRLTPRQRQIMDLWRQGYTETEIGNGLGVKPQSIHDVLRAALRHLRQYLLYCL